MKSVPTEWSSWEQRLLWACWTPCHRERQIKAPQHQWDCKTLHSCHKSPRINSAPVPPLLAGHSPCQGAGGQCSLCSPWNLGDPLPWGCTPILGLHAQLVLPWAEAEDPSPAPQFCALHCEQWPRWLCENDPAISLSNTTPPKTQAFSPGRQLSLNTKHGWAQSQRAPGERAGGCRQSGNSIPDKAGKFQRCVALSSSHSYSHTKKTHFSRKLERNALAEFFSSLKSEMQSLLKC